MSAGCAVQFADRHGRLKVEVVVRWEERLLAGTTYLFAQIRAASRASEDSCSYSLETMCTQRGNSSTFARFRPRSKMRILGSGTPRLKRDLGYGYARTECQLWIVLERCHGHEFWRSTPEQWSVWKPYLVLAVAITSCWSACHL